MKRFSRKGVLLFAGAMAVCAFAVPSMASGASWFPIDQHDTLTSFGIGFTAPGPVSSNCANNSFTTRVVSAQVLTITTGSFGGCTASGGVGSCDATWRPTGFPWRATARLTTDIQIHDVLIDITFSSCPFAQAFTLTGTLRSGSWTGNAIAQRTVVFTNAEGLTAHAFGPVPVTITGSFRATMLQVAN